MTEQRATLSFIGLILVIILVALAVRYAKSQDAIVTAFGLPTVSKVC